AGVVSIMTGVLFGALPAFFNSRREVVSALKDSARTGAARHQGLARRLLVVTQLALATMVLAAAALLLESLVRLQRVELGFTPARVTTAMVGLPPSRYPDHAAGWQFYSRLLRDIGASPGVEAVALSSGPPLAGGQNRPGGGGPGGHPPGAPALPAPPRGGWPALLPPLC